MKKISLVAASVLLAGNLAAESSLESAIKAGTFSGDVTLYGEHISNSGDTKDSGFTDGSINIEFETGELYGFKAAVGARANHDFSEKEDGDYAGSDDTKSILHTANISYANEYFGLTIGRQAIDLEWMGDYHEAAVLTVSPFEGSTITAGYSQRIAVADPDAALEDFDDLEDGAFVLDAKYEGIEGLTLNPYFYSLETDTDSDATWFGSKITYDTDLFGITAHAANSSEDASGQDDGQILHGEARLNLAGFGLSAGYVKTDDEGGVGSMDAAGENSNPFDQIAGADGNQVYEVDARTAYASVNYELAGVNLTAVYGQTEYDSDDKEEKEFDFLAEYEFTENLSVAGLYVNVAAEDSDDDYDKFTLTLAYTF